MRLDLTLASVVLSAWGICAAAPARAQEPAYSPAKVKAAFLYHFGAYVEWPENAQPDDVITIAVLGSEAIADELGEILPGRSVQNRAVRVRKISSVEDIGDAQIVYVADNQRSQLAQAVTALRGRPVLLVTDMPDGLERGAVINFAIVDRRVRFEISVPAAKQAGLGLSSRLLGVALRVEKSGSFIEGPPQSKYAATGRQARLGAQGRVYFFADAFTGAGFCVLA